MALPPKKAVVGPSEGRRPSDEDREENPRMAPPLRKGRPAWGLSLEVVDRRRKPRRPRIAPGRPGSPDPQDLKRRHIKDQLAEITKTVGMMASPRPRK
jgi:hypothetical protein